MDHSNNTWLILLPITTFLFKNYFLNQPSTDNQFWRRLEKKKKKKNSTDTCTKISPPLHRISRPQRQFTRVAEQNWKRRHSETTRILALLPLWFRARHSPKNHEPSSLSLSSLPYYKPDPLETHSDGQCLSRPVRKLPGRRVPWIFDGAHAAPQRQP